MARRQDDQALVCRRDARRGTPLPPAQGYRQVPTFVAALARHVEAVTPACDAARVARADERTCPTAQWSRLEAGRSDDLGPKSWEESA